MKTKKTIRAIFLGLLAITALSVSCSKKDLLNPLGCGSGTWASEVSDEATALSEAAVTFSNNPNLANCQRYKNASMNYFDALKAVRNCVAGTDQASFNKALNEAQTAVDEIDCSG